jgi:hypothetical protein
MLREHERNSLNHFKPLSVRPEPVEGLRDSFSSSLLVDEGEVDRATGTSRPLMPQDHELPKEFKRLALSALRLALNDE